MTPEERFERIEKLLESTAINFKTNLELLQDFMADSFRRSEERHNELGRIVTEIAQLLKRHLRDDHGGEELT